MKFDKVIHLANPLPVTLAHYQLEVQETCRRLGVRSEVLANFPAIEAGARQHGKFRTLSSAVLAPSRVLAASDVAALALWPSLGLLEPHLWHHRRQHAMVFIHDPVPLRGQIGFGWFARLLARVPRPEAPTLVSHSSEATDAMSALFPRHRVHETLHPIRSKQAQTSEMSRTVLIAGQFKPARDLALIKELGPRLRRMGLNPKIVGR